MDNSSKIRFPRTPETEISINRDYLVISQIDPNESACGCNCNLDQTVEIPILLIDHFLDAIKSVIQKSKGDGENGI